MPFENIKVRIRMILEEATHQPEDLHELQETLREELAELRAQGLPEPKDLADLEKALEERFNLPNKGK